ncbi:MAG: hypothetical protein AB7E81_01570 [Hyphomicrobiaceae bacterium]
MIDLNAVDFVADGRIDGLREEQNPTIVRHDRERSLWSFLTWSFLLAQITAAEGFFGGAAYAQNHDLALNDTSAKDAESPAHDQLGSDAAINSEAESSTAASESHAAELAATHSVPLSLASIIAGGAAIHSDVEAAVSLTGGYGGGAQSGDQVAASSADLGSSAADLFDPGGNNGGSDWAADGDIIDQIPYLPIGPKVAIDLDIDVGSGVGLGLDLGLGSGLDVDLGLGLESGLDLDLALSLDLNELIGDVGSTLQSTVEGTLGLVKQTMPAPLANLVDDAETLTSSVTSPVLETVDSFGASVVDLLDDTSLLPGTSGVVAGGFGLLDGVVGSGALPILTGSDGASGGPALTLGYSTYRIELQASADAHIGEVVEAGPTGIFGGVVSFLEGGHDDSSGSTHTVLLTQTILDDVTATPLITDLVWHS